MNGTYLGRHEGYSAPFGFAVPEGILTAGENRITLAVSNHRLAGYMGRPVSGLTSRAACECTGGIWGDVQLRTSPDGMKDLWVSTASDCKAFVVHTGKSTSEKTIRIYDGTKCICTQILTAEEQNCEFSVEGYTCWTPDNPKLYIAEVATEHQILTTNFGIRRLTVDGTKLYLNGDPYFFRGRGQITELYKVSFRMPKCEKPMTLSLTVQLSGGDTDCENQWDLYVFPQNTTPSVRMLREKSVTVLDDCDGTTLWERLSRGENVVLFGTGPFASMDVSWQISLAGRTNGHLATVIDDHPLFADFPHKGYCGRQFEHMLNGSRSVVLEAKGLAHRPILDIASAYKNVHLEALVAEFCAGRGKLLVCTLRLRDTDPAGIWLKKQILTYAAGEQFKPAQTLTYEQFASLCTMSPVAVSENTNEAMNQNDITMG